MRWGLVSALGPGVCVDRPDAASPSARRAGRERHDDESDDDGGVQRAEPAKVCVLW